MKIGGCEAISDINNCLVLNVDGMVAPMVESPFALEKFITSLDDNLTPQLRQKIKCYVNIESKTAYDNITDIISSDYCRYLNGIVLGRSDLCKSFGLTKSNVNDDESEGDDDSDDDDDNKKKGAKKSGGDGGAAAGGAEGEQ